MTQEIVTDIGVEAVKTALMLALPMLGAAFVVAIGVSVLQTVTQVREQTLSFVPKLIAVLAVFLLTLPWMMGVMSQFAQRLFMNIPNYIR